jgi:hypothetical protein
VQSSLICLVRRADTNSEINSVVKGYGKGVGSEISSLAVVRHLVVSHAPCVFSHPKLSIWNQGYVPGTVVGERLWVVAYSAAHCAAQLKVGTLYCGCLYVL